MSISRDEWKKGRTKDALETRVLQLFSRDKDRAWSLNGIRDELFPIKPNEPILKAVGIVVWSLIRLNVVLEKLTSEEKIAPRQVQTDGSSETFYALKET